MLLASTGPVNWELARQVGIASAGWGGDDPAPGEEERAALEQGVRVAELAVAERTGLTPPPAVTRIRAVRRAEFVAAAIEGLKELFEPAAERLGRAFSEAPGLGGLGPGDTDPGVGEPGQGGPQSLEALLGRMTPLLMGAQVGTVLGTLGRRSLSQYEIPLPRGGEQALLFVVPNIAAFEREWSLDPMEFRTWVALHETAHAFGIGRPWAREHVLGVLRELSQGMEFDLRALEERLEGLDLSDPQRLAEALGQPGELMESALTPDQRLLLRRLQAFMAVAEGHADHLVAGIGEGLLSSLSRIAEAVRRRHEGRAPEERAVERILGLDLSPELHALGKAFCRHVAEATDERTLARMWEGAEALPSMPELEEPRLWLARMA